MLRGLAVASVVLIVASCSGEKPTKNATPPSLTDNKVGSANPGANGGGESEIWVMDQQTITVTLGQPSSAHVDPYDTAPPKGPLDRVAIQRVVTANLVRISACYDKRLAERPGLRGETLVDFTIAHDGRVGSATGSGADRELADCVANVIRSIAFPAPAAGTVAVRYPFMFKPS